jgi:hypothetical protein
MKAQLRVQLNIQYVGAVKNNTPVRPSLLAEEGGPQQRMTSDKIFQGELSQDT